MVRYVLEGTGNFWRHLRPVKLIVIVNTVDIQPGHPVGDWLEGGLVGCAGAVLSRDRGRESGREVERGRESGREGGREREGEGGRKSERGSGGERREEK